MSDRTPQGPNEDLPSASELVARVPGLTWENEARPRQAKRGDGPPKRPAPASAPTPTPTPEPVDDATEVTGVLDPASVPTGALSSELARLPGGAPAAKPAAPVSAPRPEPEKEKGERVETGPKAAAPPKTAAAPGLSAPVRGGDRLGAAPDVAAAGAGAAPAPPADPLWTPGPAGPAGPAPKPDGPPSDSGWLGALAPPPAPDTAVPGAPPRGAVPAPAETHTAGLGVPAAPAPALDESAAPVNGWDSYTGTRVDQSAQQFMAVPPAAPARRETSDDLSPDRVLRRVDQAPLGRRLLNTITLGRMGGESPAQAQERAWTALAQTRVPRDHRVAVLSLKGGVGKTSTTAGLGHTLASLRGDMVTVVDANPDRGTLGDRIGTRTHFTIRNLLEAERERGIPDFPDLAQFLSQATSRVHVLASDRDPATAKALSAQDYAATIGVLKRFVPVTITDSGTGLLFDALSGEGGVLDEADQVVVVCGPGVDEARSASATLDFLEGHRWGHLVDTAVVAVTKVPAGKRSRVDRDEIEAHFRTRVRQVVRIPLDEHIAEGGVIELERLAPGTRRAFLELAAAVGERFNMPKRESVRGAAERESAGAAAD